MRMRSHLTKSETITRQSVVVAANREKKTVHSSWLDRDPLGVRPHVHLHFHFPLIWRPAAAAWSVALPRHNDSLILLVNGTLRPCACRCRRRFDGTGEFDAQISDERFIVSSLVGWTSQGEADEKGKHAFRLPAN